MHRGCFKTVCDWFKKKKKKRKPTCVDVSSLIMHVVNHGLAFSGKKKPVLTLSLLTVT